MALRSTVNLDEALDMVEELVGQSLYSEDGIQFDHACISTYEAACEFLARARPDRWKLTRRGVREMVAE